MKATNSIIIFFLLAAMLFSASCSGNSKESNQNPADSSAYASPQSAQAGDLPDNSAAGEVVTVRAKNDSEGHTKDVFNMIDQAEAAKEKGENVVIQIS